MISSRFPSIRKRTVVILAVALALLVGAIVYGRVSEELAERARMDFVRKFIESARIGGAFHEHYVMSEKRQDILESRPLMTERYRVTRGGSSAGQHDYNLEFENGACGHVSVWDGNERSASLYAWRPPKGGCGISAKQ